MKNIFLFLTVATFLFACKKNDQDQNTTLAAQTYSDLAYGSDAMQKMDLYLPSGRNTDSTKLIIIVHGGAWIEGDKSEFSSYVTILQQRLPGYAIANINYRLATTASNHFPSQENDMKAAVDFLVSKSNEYHISQKIVLLGASAGGHLSLLQAYKYSSPKIKAVVDFFGPADMVDMYNNAGSPINQLAMQILMSGSPATNASMYQQSSPINFVNTQTPPTIILHGTADVVVNISESIALKNKLLSFGVVNQMVTYQGLGHDVWPPATMTDAFDKIEAFLKTNVR